MRHFAAHSVLASHDFAGASRWCAALLVTLAVGTGCKSEEPTVAPSPEPAAETPVAAVPEGSAVPAEAAAPAPRPVAPVLPVLTNQQPVADRELAARLGLAPPDPLMVAPLLTHADIRELVRYDGELAIRTLDGITPTPNYNAVRLGAGEQYGFALQVWRLDEARQVTPRYDRLQQTYIVATPDAPALADASFHGEFAGVRYQAFSHRASRTVAVVSCDAALCTQPQARSLAERVLTRL